MYWGKFVLWIEFWINVVSLPLFYWMMTLELYAADIYQYIYGAGMVMIVVYLFYYQFLIRSIRKFDYAGDVKGSLTKIYKYLKFYILHYKVVVWGLIPISCAVSTLLALEEIAAKDETFAFYSTPFWVMIGFMAVASLLISALFNFLVNLIYGRKIKRLKEMVNQL